MKTLAQVAQSIDNALRSILEDAGMEPKTFTIYVDVFGVDYNRMETPETVGDKLPYPYTVQEARVSDYARCNFFADPVTCPEYIPEPITTPEGKETPF